MEPEAKQETASDFLTRVGAEIQSWLHEQTLARTAAGMQWVLTAEIGQGHIMIVHQMSPHGQSLIKLAGQTMAGVPCLVLMHKDSAKFTATYIPKPKSQRTLSGGSKRKRRPKNEIGYHSTMINGRKIDASSPPH
jgi:hypothetical protein